MRIARVHVEDQVRTAVVDGEAMRVLADGVQPLDLLTLPTEARDRLVAARAEAEIALADARLAAPIQPASFRDFMAFEEHVEGFRAIDGGRGRVVRGAEVLLHQPAHGPRPRRCRRVPPVTERSTTSSRSPPCIGARRAAT